MQIFCLYYILVALQLVDVISFYSHTCVTPPHTKRQVSAVPEIVMFAPGVYIALNISKCFQFLGYRSKLQTKRMIN